MADLITNRPEGVMAVKGLVMLEVGTFRLRFRIVEDGVGHNWTGWTVDYAQIDTPNGVTGLVTLNVTLEADGWVEIEGDLAQQTVGLVGRASHPNGMRALMTVRLKDPTTFPVYLIAPSEILIKNSPGVPA